MFNDPIITVMGMLLLFFMGMLVMFLFVIRSLSAQSAAMREVFGRQQAALTDIERQLMDMNFSLRRLPGGAKTTSDANPPFAQQGTDLMAMLDAVGKTAPGEPLFFESMAPAGTAAPDEYDPATDPDLFEGGGLTNVTFDNRKNRLAEAAKSAANANRHNSLNFR